jgi:AraC-like DNA-binding protein
VSILQKSLKPTIKWAFVKQVLAGLEHQGIDAQALLHQLGFDALADRQPLLSVAQFSVLSQAIEDALQDEMLGFFIAPMPKGSLFFINKTMTQLPTLQEALGALNAFYGLFNEGQDIFKIDAAPNTRITLAFHSDLQGQSPYYMQRLLLATYKQLCWLVKSKIPLKGVTFCCDIQDSVSELQFVFGCDDIYEGEVCKLEFDHGILTTPIIQATQGAELFSQKANFYTLLWPSLETLEVKIRLLIGEDISKGFPSLEALAKRMAISPATLSRRLKQQGIHYQNIKDDIRRETMEALLLHSKLSIKDIAFRLGFLDSSAFSKTFKAWYGMTASQFRQQHLKQDH